MSVVDAYAPCPCGSDEKYKRCCQKAESYIERAERLEDNGQPEAALGVLADGLSKHPAAPWLHIRKAAVLAEIGQPSKGVEALSTLLSKNPGHFGAFALKVRLLLEIGDAAGAVDQLQGALARGDAAVRARCAGLAMMVGGVLAQSPAAAAQAAGLKHLELARALAGDDADALSLVETTQARARSAPAPSAWAKNPYALSGPPDGLSPEARGRFEEALRWADAGLWRDAAAAFELLSADRNLGLCRLWLADPAAAAPALERYVRSQSQPQPQAQSQGQAGGAKGKAPTDAVDLEALRQSIDDAPGPDPLEEVELSWPIRDRAGLLGRLAADPRCVRQVEEVEGGGVRPIDEFLLLDRPEIKEAAADLKPSAVPAVVGRIVVGDDAATVETRDDGGLDAIIDAFAAAAGPTVPPAQPRTRVVGAVSRVDHVLDVLCYPPAEMPRRDRERIVAARLAERVAALWPDTPLACLDGKTPVQAAAAGGFETPLRAALLLLEESGRGWSAPPDWQALRARLNVPAEPPIDHATLDVAALHLGRLALLDPRRLDDDRLFAVYLRVREWGLVDLMPTVAREATTRRGLLDRPDFPVLSVYTELAMTEAVEGRREQAVEWSRKGRAADSRRRTFAPVAWDLLDLEVQMGLDAPDVWVPELVVLMDRYERDRDATRILLLALARFGLIRLAPAEDGRTMNVDASLLQALVARYGPRVQTAAGEVGVSAVRGGIWTPGGPTPPAGDRPRIILPGQ